MTKPRERPFSLYQMFFSFLYPVFLRWIDRPTFQTLKEREETQWLSASAIEDIQLDKLRDVLINAVENVPFYREEFQRIGFDPRKMKSLDEFRALPFSVTKEDVRNNPEAFIAENGDRSKLDWHRTGGSTGEPLLFATDNLTGAASSSALVKCLHWWGAKLGDRHAIFWGSPTFISRGEGQTISRLKTRIVSRLMNRRVFLNYNLSEKNMPSIRRDLERFKPVYIRGMPSSLYIFAKFLLENEAPLDKGSPLFIHSACEQLFDWQREVIEEAFRAPVVNTYGLSELADIAFQAPCGSMHMMDEDVLVELAEFEGGDKRIVATQLNNKISPLIKYETNDIATGIGTCSCPLGLRTLEGIKGRAHDFVRGPDGRYIHGQFFTHLFVFEKGITKFQVIQKALDEFHIKLVTTDEYSLSTESRVSGSIRSEIDSGVTLTFEYVDVIPLTKRGKHRWIISELD